MAHACDARVVGCGDGVAFRLVEHCAELADSEWFAILPNAMLKEKHGAFRIYFYENSDDQKRHKQHNKPKECRDTIEAPLEEKPYFVFIFHHAAWPPYLERP